MTVTGALSTIWVIILVFLTLLIYIQLLIDNEY